MTLEKCIEIFRTKYPEGDIYRTPTTEGRYSGFSVVFRRGGKVYDYSTNTYGVLLRRLGFKVLYKHDVENINESIAEKEELIKQGGRFNRFTKKLMVSVEELEDQIRKLKEEKANAILV